MGAGDTGRMPHPEARTCPPQPRRAPCLLPTPAGAQPGLSQPPARSPRVQRHPGPAHRPACARARAIISGRAAATGGRSSRHLATRVATTTGNPSRHAPRHPPRAARAVAHLRAGATWHAARIGSGHDDDEPAHPLLPPHRDRLGHRDRAALRDARRHAGRAGRGGLPARDRRPGHRGGPGLPHRRGLDGRAHLAPTGP